MEKDSVPETGGHSNQNDAFYHILEYIDTHSGEPLEIQELADMCHMSYSHFARLFRESYGRSCREYITYIRLNKAQDYLLHTDYDLNEIALETGFFDASHFIRTYKKWRGITPKQERVLYLIDEFHKRDINVLAEGIENKEELDFLLTTDVDYLQGYYLGMPE